MRWFTCFIVLALWGSCSVHADSGDPIRFVESDVGAGRFIWSGFYFRNSELCTYPNSDDSCADEFNDYLNISPVGETYSVELNSTQAGQHVCDFSIVMKEVAGLLAYRTPYGDVLLQRNGSFLEVSSQGIDPTASGLGVCGAHADIDGLKFPLGNDQAIHKSIRIDPSVDATNPTAHATAQ